MPQLIQNSAFAPGKRRGRLPQFLENESGVTPISSYQSTWSIATDLTAVVTACGDTLRIELLVPDSPPPRSALALHAELPGNLRFARHARGNVLLADVPCGGEADISQYLTEIRAGLLFALGRRPLDVNAEPVVANDIQSVIDELNWPGDAVVQFDGGWEFRPRLQGDAVPVQAAINGRYLRLSRTLVSARLANGASEAVAEQALRFNAQLRLSRLTIVDGTVAAEARLHGRSLTPKALDAACRAVAVAGLHVESALHILAANPGLAALYLEMFGSAAVMEGSTPSADC